MEMGLVETIKREKNKAGVITTKKKPSAKEVLGRIKNDTKAAKKITKKVIKETNNPKAPQVNVQMLIDAFKGTLVMDTDKNGFTNFRYPGSKKIIFYCIQRNFGITVSTRNDSAKSGWKSQRLATKQDLKTFVASIKAQVGD